MIANLTIDLFQSWDSQDAEPKQWDCFLTLVAKMFSDVVAVPGTLAAKLATGNYPRQMAEDTVDAAVTAAMHIRRTTNPLYEPENEGKINASSGLSAAEERHVVRAVSNTFARIICARSTATSIDDNF